MQLPDIGLPRSSTLAGYVAGIVTAPGTVFDDLRDRMPDPRHWIIPPLLYIALTLAGTGLVISRPGPTAQLRSMAEQEFLPQIEEYVRTGMMTAEQSELFRRFITPGTTPFALLQVAGTTIAAAAALLFFALVLRQIGTSALGRKLPYRKTLEIAGLTFVIALPERIITTALILMTGSVFANPGPGLLFLHEPRGTAFLILSSINLFTLWEVGVAASGLAHFCDRDYPKVLVLLLALWFLWSLLSVAPLFFGGS